MAILTEKEPAERIEYCSLTCSVCTAHTSVIGEIQVKGTDTLEVGKQIDAISGATISVIGLVNDIREKSEILQRLKKAN